MKLISILMSVWCFTANAQGIVLTKDETINYIHKKGLEAERQKFLYLGSSSRDYTYHYIWDQSLTRSGDYLNLRVTRSGEPSEPKPVEVWNGNMNVWTYPCNYRKTIYNY